MSRQKLTLEGERKALDDEMCLRDVGLKGGGELFIKDLGAQISWRTVFVIEYVSLDHAHLLNSDIAECRLGLSFCIQSSTGFPKSSMASPSSIAKYKSEKCRPF